MKYDPQQAQSFDFETHGHAVVAEYLKRQGFYRDLSSVVARILDECLRRRDIKVHSVDHRAKEPDSVGRKAATPSERDPNQPKYPNPLSDITDFAGVRIITYFPGTLSAIDRVLRDEFNILEKSDKSEELLVGERFGYQSIHYLVRVNPERTRLAEYQLFEGATVEVQVRTILQHAWAEIEHDIQYKSATTIPSEIRRRFMALAGMLEIADREFQTIQDADQEITHRAREMVDRGDLEGVEITAQALKRFLDRRLGSDGRISDWNYDRTARLLRSLGFRDLKQVAAAIAQYSDDILSQLAWGSRQGQITRFEAMLLAALGGRFIERHPWRGSDWFGGRRQQFLERFREAGIPVRTYDPIGEQEVGDLSVTTMENGNE